MIPNGKGMFIWNVAWCEGGNVELIADLAERVGMQHLLVKIADGSLPHNIEGGVDLARALVVACEARGIQVWGWQYIYFFMPITEADIAVRRIVQTGVVGFVVDAEGECRNKPAQVRSYMSSLPNQYPALPIGLSSYRYPRLHPELP